MTRDEAVTILQIRQFGPYPFPDYALEGMNRQCSANLIDAFVALGMLKLDAPKSVEQRVIDAFIREPNGGNSVMAILKEAGLKIVVA